MVLKLQMQHKTKYDMTETKRPSLGEISTIRDILMGEQMVEYNARFDTLQKQLSEAEARLNQRIDNWIANQSEALQDLRAESEQRLQALEAQLEAKAGQLDQKIQAVSAADQVRLGDMLSDLGKQLSARAEQS